MKKIFRNNQKGFTLVELLATIVVLSIVVSLTIYTALNIIGNAKEKSYKVTISNIESNASNYLLENKDKLNFVSSNENTEYQCITVKNLIDYGYLNDNITKSKVNEIDTVKLDRYVYVERNSTTKAITKVVYLMNNKYDQLCKTSIKSKANITFSSNPGFDTWSKTKDVTITYGLSNVGTGLSGYTYNYNYTKNSTPKNGNGSFNQFTEVKTTNVNGNGTLLAEIKFNDESVITSSKEITKIDTVGPVIALNSNETNIVKATVTIPLKVTDVGSGINQDSFTKEDVLVKIGGNTITNITLTKGTCASDNECIYNLKIDDTTSAGKVTIKIDSNKVLDKIDNGNNETTLNTNITFDNTAKYKINHYVRNMGENTYTLNSSEDGTGKINDTLTLANLKKPIAGFTYDGGYTSGNTERPTSGEKETITLPTNDNTVINLYYRRNYLYVQYNMNGGSLASEHGEGYGANNNLVTFTSKNKTQDKFKRGVYGGYVGYINDTTLKATYGLHNWNSTTDINITYTGKVAKKDAEWCIDSAGDGKCYGHNDTSIKAVDMAKDGKVDLSTGDKTITLYVNWMNAAEIPTTAYCKTGLVYNGNSQTITNNAGAGYTFSNNVQTNAESYQVTATLNSGYVWTDGTSAAKTFSCSIGKAAATITCADKNYNGNAQTIASCTGGTIANASQTNAGTYQGTCIGDSNHNNAESKNCKINKIDATCPTITAHSGNYDGKAHSITVSGGSGGTIKYRTDNSTWSTTNPTRTNAGTTTVYVKVVGDSNHNDKTCGNAKITISKVDATCPALTAYSGDYDGKAHSITVSGGSGGTKKYSTDNSTWQDTNPTRTDTGSTTVYVKVIGDTNHNDKTCGNAKITINSNVLKCCATSCSGSYNCSQIGGSKAVWQDNKCWLTYTDRTTCPYQWTTDASQCKYITGSGGGSSGGGSSGGGGCTGTWCECHGGCSGPQNCFLQGTKVITSNGFKDIDKIKIGDMVLTYNEVTKKNEYKKVLQTTSHVNFTDEIYTIKVDNEIIQVTEGHHFYINNENGINWLAAKYLKVGDKVKYADGTYHIIDDIFNEERIDTVYNLSIEDNHNYYVTKNKILVHNVLC